MLPANLAKTRAAGRGAYGELPMKPSAGGGGGPSAGTAAFRYAPYPLPGSAAHHSMPLVNLVSAPVQYAPMYDVASAVQAAQSVKRAFAVAAAAASLRPQQAAASAAPTLTYSMSDLLGVQGLDMGALYHPIPASVGL